MSAMVQAAKEMVDKMRAEPVIFLLELDTQRRGHEPQTDLKALLPKLTAEERAEIHTVIGSDPAWRAAYEAAVGPIGGLLA